MILFSVILPTYNDLKNLKNCIRSIKRQTFTNYEIIIVNDASKDNTKEYLNKLNYSNLKVINLEKNQGPANARNQAIKNSVGKWLCFIDSDDFWFQEKLEIISNNIKLYNKNNYQVFCHNLILKDRKSKIKKKLYSGPLKTNSEYKSLLISGNKLLKTALIISLNVKGSCHVMQGVSPGGASHAP